MHNRGMQDSDSKLPGCTRENCVCLRNQDELTKLLLEHEDPHVRILAHMSSRQLAMVESINNVNETLRMLVSAQNSLKGKVESGFRDVNERIDGLAEKHSIIETRFDDFENEFPTGSLTPT